MACPFVDCMRRCELVCGSLQPVAGGGPLNTYVIQVYGLLLLEHRRDAK